MSLLRLRGVVVADAVRAVLPPSLVDADLDDAAVDDAVAAVVWSAVPEPGDEVAGLVREVIGDRAAAELLLRSASQRGWLEAAGAAAAELAPRLSDALARWKPRAEPDRMLRALQQGAAWHQVLVWRAASEWPQQLDDLGLHAPAALWVRGDARLLARSARSMALVGSRASSGYGEHVAMEAVEGVVARGFATVSGAAYGIDACVHRATLATAGTTIAVLAGGLDRLYPPGNDELLRRVEDRGVLVAEVPSGSAPSRWRFLARNRLIAALGSATVVIEASTRSGSINTAGHAATLGRPLGAVPGAVTSGASAGCHRLIRDYGAQLVQSAEEMCELVDPPGAPQDALAPRLGADETRVLDALSRRRARTEEEIAQLAGLSVADVRATLGLLDLAGAIESRGTGWVQR